MAYPYWPNQQPGTELISSFKTLNVSTLNADNISSAVINTSTLNANNVSTGFGFVNICETSTIFTYEITLDNQTLNANATDLLLNGIPIATTSNISSVSDWALDPAVSTIQCDNNDIAQFRFAYGSSISTTSGVFSTLTVNTGNISTLNLSSINGYVPDNVANWANYTAVTNVNLGNHGINAQGNTFGFPNSQLDTNLKIGAASYLLAPDVIIYPTYFQVGDIGTAARKISMASIQSIEIDSVNGMDITLGNSLDVISAVGINLTGGGGISIFGGGGVSIVGGGGILALGATITLGAGLLTMLGGQVLLGSGNLTIGSGAIEIGAGTIVIGTATTAGGGINSYGGIIDSFQTGGTGGGFRTQNCDFICRGTGAVRTNAIVPGDYNSLTIQNLSSTVDSIYIHNVQTFDNYNSTMNISGVSTLNGVPVENFLNPAGVSSLQDWAKEPANSTIRFDVGVPPVIEGTGLTLDSGVATLKIPGNVSLGSYIDLNGNFPDGALHVFQKDTGMGTPAKVSISAIDFAPYGISQFWYNPSYDRFTYLSSIGLVRRYIAETSDLVNLSTNSILTSTCVASTISTATIYGANPSILGIGLPGLTIDAQNIFFSTVQTNITGYINCSTIGANLHTGKAVNVSTVSTQVLNAAGIVGSGNVITPGDLYVSTSYLTLDTPTIATATKNIFYGSTIQGNAFVIPSVSTVSLTTTNTVGTQGQPAGRMLVSGCDLDTGQNDIWCNQIRVGAGNPINAQSEIIFYDANANQRGLQTALQDRTIRVVSTINGNTGGYLLDTGINPPFFSTINNSTSMMAFFPSSINSTIGVSTLSFIPPKVAAGAFNSISTQNLVANTPLVLWHENTSLSVGGVTASTTAIVIPYAGNYEVNTSIQFSKTGGSGTCDFWFRKNGVDIPASGSELFLPSAGNGQCLGNVSLIESFAAGDKIEVVVASIDSGVSATFFPATTSPFTRPSIPSLITTVKCLNY